MLLVPHGSFVFRRSDESLLDCGTRILRVAGEDGPGRPLDQLCNGIWTHGWGNVASRASVVKGYLLLSPQVRHSS